MNVEDKAQSTGMYLLNKSKKGIIRMIFSRLGLIVLLLAIQIFVFVEMFLSFEEFLPHIYGGIVIFTLVSVIYLLNSKINPTAKITWLIIISVVPVFGALLLLFTQFEFGHRALKFVLTKRIDDTRNCLKQQPETLEALKQESPETALLAHYLGRTGCFPVFDQTAVSYYPLGEEMFEELLRQLEQAKHFIFMEYFIVDEGLMWGKILEILVRKAREGVDVRVMYDGTCEFSTLPHDYPKRLRALGIQCRVFAPATPFVSTHYNYRDHRKILVIDGHTAFTGGVNLADEYINHIRKYGHWKDTAIMLKGKAVPSFTLMFLQMWGLNEKTVDFATALSYPAFPCPEAGGYVIPFGDVPLDGDKVGERVYMDILNQSKRYVHIMSPYLILDGEMETALKFAAERGVEVSLILPGIPDKKSPYALAKTHYASLMESGVKIYEYEPGFVHAKVFVSDDCKAVVGTINLDYRSLYHHFECAAYLYQTDCIPDVEQDFQNTLQQCRQVTKDSLRALPLHTKLLGRMLKAIAPLM